MEVLNTGANTETTTTAAPEGHDQAMIDKVDQKSAQIAQEAPQEPQQQELLGGKFKSTEDLLKAYQELEKKQSQPKQEEAPKAEAPADLDEDKASELIDKAGIDVDAMADHYYENGGLTEEHYAALEKAGVPKAYVDQYIAGVEAEATQQRDAIYNEIGGEEQFQAISQWAVANLSAQELKQYNDAVDSGDMAHVRSAVMGLAYRYQRDNGREPKLVNGGTGGSAGGFESVAQLTAAMKDPRYTNDPAYREEVRQKLGRSNIL